MEEMFPKEERRIVERLSFERGLMRLMGATAKLSNDDVASAFNCACCYAFYKHCNCEPDKHFREMLNNLSPAARVLFDLMDVLMDIGA